LGVWLDTNWSQFEGLLGNLGKYEEQINNRLLGCGVEVANAEAEDNLVKAHEVANYLKSSYVDMIFLYVFNTRYRQ